MLLSARLTNIHKKSIYIYFCSAVGRGDWFWGWVEPGAPLVPLLPPQEERSLHTRACVTSWWLEKYHCLLFAVSALSANVSTTRWLKLILACQGCRSHCSDLTSVIQLI